MKEASTTLSGNLPTDVGPCLDDLFRKLRFPAREGEGVTTVTYPIAFSPGG